MIYTVWKVFRFNRREEKTHVSRYYRDLGFREIDLAMKKAYLWQNPYRASRKYWQEATYGETPLSVFELVGKKVGLSTSDTFVDLGAGRGRGVFFIHRHFGCKAIGIERVPLFVEKANDLKRKFEVGKVDFFEEDLMQATLPKGTVFYAAWTCFSDDLVLSMTRLFERLPKKTKVATVSEPIASSNCKLTDRFTAPFAWGEGEIYVHEII
jgi:hypothetical protein